MHSPLCPAARAGALRLLTPDAPPIPRPLSTPAPVEGYSLGLALTDDCNLACAHCYRDTLRIGYLSLADVQAICAAVPVRSINLGTGENGLHPQFREILRFF